MILMDTKQNDFLEKLQKSEYKMISTFIPDKRFALHAMIRDCGHSLEKSHEYRFNNMERGKSGFAVLQLTLSGLGCFEEDKRIWQLSPGMLMVATVPGPHCYYLPDDSDEWDFVYFVIYGREALRILTAVERLMGSVFPLKQNSQVVETMENALCFFSNNTNAISAFDNSRYAYDICMNLGRECFLQPELGDDPRFMEVKQFIKDNLSRDVSVAEMAEISGLSRSHFTRLFSETEGVSPNTYLENLRLKTAVQLLRAGLMTVAEAACSCGYYDVNYFCRVFKKRMGLTPGEFRKYSGRAGDPSGTAQ